MLRTTSPARAPWKTREAVEWATLDWYVVQAPSRAGTHWLHPASRSRGKPTTTSSVESRRAAILGAATRHFKRGMCRRSRGCRAVHRRGTPRGRFGAAEGPSLTVSRDRCQAGRGQELTPAKVGFGDYWKQSTWPPSALPDREAALGPRLSTVARCTSLSALPRWPVPAYRQVKVAPECQHEHRRVLPCHGQLLCLRIEGQRRYWAAYARFWHGGRCCRDPDCERRPVRRPA